jgi:hypothetical protein
VGLNLTRVGRDQELPASDGRELANLKIRHDGSLGIADFVEDTHSSWLGE